MYSGMVMPREIYQHSKVDKVQNGMAARILPYLAIKQKLMDRGVAEMLLSNSCPLRYSWSRLVAPSRHANPSKVNKKRC